MRRSIGRPLTLLLAFLSLPALAAEGRIPIAGPPPVVIGAAGKYIVTRNIFTAAGPIIDVTVGDVDIDLNGMMLNSTSVADPVIRAVAAGVAGLTIHNGTIIGGKNAVEVNARSHVSIEDIKWRGIVGSSEGILLIGATDFAVRRCQLTAAGLDAIRVDGFGGGGPPVTGTIERNIIESSASGITVLHGSAVGIIHNRIESITVAHGILLDTSSGCLIAENTIQDIRIDGIHITALFPRSTGNKLLDNVIHRTNNNGIYLSPSAWLSLLLNNVVTLCSANGIFIDGAANNLEGNTLGGNTIFGLYFSPGSFDNVYRRNMARTDGGGFCAGFPATSDICDEGSGNSSPGDNLVPFLL